MRRLTREHCDYLVRLPMAGSVSSLNVSVATGVCLFEALRQRGAKAIGDYLNNLCLQTPQTNVGAGLLAMASLRSSRDTA